MKVAHLYWVNNGNWGDVAVGDITKKLFSYFIKDCIYEDIDVLLSKNEDEWDEYCETINKNDLLLIGGGGLLGWMGYFIKYTNFLEKIKVPIIIYGIGLNSFRHSDGKYDTLMFDNSWLELLKEKCLFISVRNDGTQEEILNHNKINFLESPESCLWTNLFYKSSRLISDKYVVFCLANDYSAARLNYNNTDFNELNTKIIGVVDKLKRKNIKVQFIHHRNNDEDYVSDINNEIEWNVEKEIQSRDISRGLCLYEHAECAISMRGHGQIIPISYNTPIITISNQTKNSYFAEKMEIDNYLIDVDEKELVDMIDWAVLDIKRNRLKIQERILMKKKDLWARTLDDFRTIEKRINK
jgi:polysaccharide pyruvyl transferase WcaK-like protein